MKQFKTILFALLILTVSVTTASLAYADQTVTVKDDANSNDSCGETNTCVEPFDLVISVGETVTWIAPYLGGQPPIQFIGGTPESGQVSPAYPDTRNIIWGEPQQWVYADPGVFPYFAPDYPWITGQVTAIPITPFTNAQLTEIVLQQQAQIDTMQILLDDHEARIVVLEDFHFFGNNAIDRNPLQEFNSDNTIVSASSSSTVN